MPTASHAPVFAWGSMIARLPFLLPLLQVAVLACPLPRKGEGILLRGNALQKNPSGSGS